MAAPIKAIGGFLLVLGIVGLLLALILWLPTKINQIVMVLISMICTVFIWGGGKLSLSTLDARKESINPHQPMTQQPQGMQQRITCPKCGRQYVLGQRFCGTCGSSLASCCPICGAATGTATGFCSNCGNKLG